MKKLLALAAAVLVTGTFTLQASPKDWVGKELPELKLEYLAKAPELKGKPAIVEFWATWCPPCRATIPHLNELHAKFKDKGLVIVGISDEDKKTVEDFQKKLPMNYNVGLDEKGDAIKKFGVTGIPHAFVVNKEGKIVWEGHPGMLKEEEIEKVLK